MQSFYSLNNLTSYKMGSILVRNMAFMKFEETNKRQEDRITVTGHSSFGFPTKFYNDNNIDQFKYVTLFFDPDTTEVGFLFHNNETEKHKFSILKSKQGYGGSIVASSFFRSNGLNPKVYRGRYVFRKENIPEVGEIFVIKIKAKEEPKIESASEAS